jgi:hypothetical protein
MDAGDELPSVLRATDDDQDWQHYTDEAEHVEEPRGEATLEAARSNADLPVLAALTLLGRSTPGVVSAPSMAAWA